MEGQQARARQAQTMLTWRLSSADPGGRTGRSTRRATIARAPPRARGPGRRQPPSCTMQPEEPPAAYKG
eukprot:8641374-Pyramimonas_sp.AAC.1